MTKTSTHMITSCIQIGQQVCFSVALQLQSEIQEIRKGTSIQCHFFKDDISAATADCDPYYEHLYQVMSDPKPGGIETRYLICTSHYQDGYYCQGYFFYAD